MLLGGIPPSNTQQHTSCKELKEEGGAREIEVVNNEVDNGV